MTRALLGRLAFYTLDVIERGVSRVECAVSGHEWVVCGAYTVGCACCGKKRLINGRGRA